MRYSNPALVIASIERTILRLTTRSYSFSITGLAIDSILTIEGMLKKLHDLNATVLYSLYDNNCTSIMMCIRSVIEMNALIRASHLSNNPDSYIAELWQLGFEEIDMRKKNKHGKHIKLRAVFALEELVKLRLMREAHDDYRECCDHVHFSSSTRAFMLTRLPTDGSPPPISFDRSETTRVFAEVYAARYATYALLLVNDLKRRHRFLGGQSSYFDESFRTYFKGMSREELPKFRLSMPALRKAEIIALERSIGAIVGRRMVSRGTDFDFARISKTHCNALKRLLEGFERKHRYVPMQFVIYLHGFVAASEDGCGNMEWLERLWSRQLGKTNVTRGARKLLVWKPTRRKPKRFPDPEVVHDHLQMPLTVRY